MSTEQYSESHVSLSKAAAPLRDWARLVLAEPDEEKRRITFNFPGDARVEITAKEFSGK